MFKKLNQIKNWLLVIFVLIALLSVLSLGHTPGKSELEYGVTFSKKEAEDLKLDWQKLYLAMLDDLNVRKLRLAAYWDEVEVADEQYKWQDLDWQVEQASNRQAKIILAIGERLPRWPECHIPAWSNNLTKEQQQLKLLGYIRQTVSRYKNQTQIQAWQIENEPFLGHFGECPVLDADFLDQEIALTKSLDSRPVVVTDSGELSFWYQAASRADIFGTTMYRDTFSSFLNSYVHYPITASFFKLKKNLVGFFAKPKKWVVIELQAEPWAPVPFQEITQAERDRTMSLDKFKTIIDFSSQTGFREFYLWGVEWWYWEKTVNNRPEFWELARGLFSR